MLVRLEQRPEASKSMVYVSPLIAVVLTILTAMIMFAALGVDPVKAIETFFIEPVSTLDGVAELFVKATPLVLIGVGLALGFQANVWNIGAEGQLYAGAIAGVWVALTFDGFPTLILIPAMLAMSCVAGAAWALVPTLMRLRLGIGEVITTILMNFVGIYTAAWMVHGPLQATLLMQAACAHKGRCPVQFDFRGVHPVFHGDALDIMAREDEDGNLALCTGQAGHQGMQAHAMWEGTL